MFCSHCGSQTAENLNYCKNCGSRNAMSSLVVSNASSRPFAVAAMVIGGGGLFGVFPLLREMLHNGVDPRLMVFIIVAYLAALVLMFSILVGHIWKNSGDIRIKGSGQSHADEPISFRRAKNTAQLPEPQSIVPSVTEHTTRTLDKVPVRGR